MKDDDRRTLTPRLRFPEFREGKAWDGISGDELFDSVNNRNATPGLPILAITQEHGAIPRDQIDYHVSVTEKSIESYKVVERGDFIISLRSFQGGIEYSEHHGICSPAYVILRKKSSVFDRYFKHLFKSFRFIQQLTRNIEGLRDGKMISYKQFSEQLIPTPEPAEQQKIADCLTSLDELIAAQGRKVEALKAHKKALMQQLFPREGELFPHLRFPKFRDGLGWDNRRLGDFIRERYEIAAGTVPLFSLTIEDGVTAKTDRYERSFLVTNKEDAYKLVRPNDFAFNPMNLRFGAIGRHSGSEPVALSKYYNIFFCDESVDPRFCENYFRSDGMVAYYDVMATGTLIEKRRVHFDRFLNFSIPFPQFEEQQRIADCLSALDARIAAETDKLAALKTHKQGLMQQLFPSPEGG